MYRQKLEQSGDQLIVTIPRDEIERHGLKAGQLVGLVFYGDVEGETPDPRIPGIVASFFDENPEALRILFEEDLDKIR